jgi:hypothetical protein
MWRIFCLLLAAAALASGCSGSGTAPTPGGPLRFTLQQAPTFAGIDGVLFTARLENVSQNVIDLTFPSSCQFRLQFADRSGQSVTPVGGGLACATVITHQTLGPAQSFAQAFTVRAGTAPASGAIVLPAGDYTVLARLDDTTHRLTSDPLPFVVR